MATFTEVGNAIVTIIRANVSKNNYVYDFVNPNPEGYPAINVEAYDGVGEFADTARNRRGLLFRLIVQQERVDVGPKEAERITRALVDQLISVFDSETNTTLNDTCIFARPIPSKWGYLQGPDVDVRSAEIILEAVDVVNR